MGAIAATVGSAVGLGNIWRFPYEAGANGGGAFLCVYLVFVLVMGIPAIVAEFVIGRSSHQNVLGSLRSLAPGKHFHWMSYVCIIASLMIVSFYSVVCGWILEYLYQSVTGGLLGHTAEEYSANFASFLSHPWRNLMWTLIFLLINHLVLRRGLKGGIERISNLMMPLLAVIMVVFCVRSLLMPGAREGLLFLFRPDFSKLTPEVAINAMGQAFFSLSLGVSCLLTYASYFKDTDSLMRNAGLVAVFDTLFAILAGMIIFPAVFSYGTGPEAGPKLIFEVLPNIFGQMAGGALWSVLFFVLLLIAALTSAISMSEISIAFFSEEFKLPRQKASFLSTLIVVVFGSLCALSFGVLSDFKIAGMTVFNLFDYLASNILMPLGGLFFCVFAGWILDRSVLKRQLAVATPGGRFLMRALVFCLLYVAPVAIALVFFSGLLK